jgi:lipopolysaccharide biosynthesis glycosyltransferase
LLKLFSIIISSLTPPSQFKFHILATNTSIIQVWTNLHAQVFPHVTYDIKSWQDVRPPSFPHLSNSSFDREHIFARFYLPYIFDIDRFIYLDNDVIVNADLYDLYTTPLQGSILNDVFHTVLPKSSQVMKNCCTMCFHILYA